VFEGYQQLDQDHRVRLNTMMIKTKKIARIFEDYLLLDKHSENLDLLNSDTNERVYVKQSYEIFDFVIIAW
jgi:hypothetical protein